MTLKSASPSKAGGDPDTALRDALVRLGLARPGETPRMTPLDGGVSSDIVRVDLAGGPVCVKRALPRLKVAATWEVPVERNAAEADWFRAVAEIAPEAAPQILAEDRAAGLFVMEFLDPEEYPVWKQQLRDGVVEPATAKAVGAILAKIHAATSGRSDIAAKFANDDMFHAIRLDPYLIATADAYPDYADALKRLSDATAANRIALVHGDVSPKNILVGPDGPVFLDAECAWYGDPAFDLAFCLNHLLLKCVWRPQWSVAYLQCFDALAAAYLAGVTWEPPDALEDRAARLLAGLLLARIDGKSPVEYITDEADKDRVRATAKDLLDSPSTRLADSRARWRDGCGA